MSKPRKPATPSLGADEVEAEFYDALQSGDVQRLMACWADEDDIVCVHPGGMRLVGAQAIRQVFDAMCANAQVSVQLAQLHKVETLSSSVHSVLERVRIVTDQGPHEAAVLTTNVYHKTPLGWRMVVHHASAAASTPGLEAHEAQPILH